MVIFPKTLARGLVLNLGYDAVDIAIFDKDTEIKPGDLVYGSGRQMDIRVGDFLLGHVLDGIGNPIDFDLNLSIESPNQPKTVYVERKAPGVITRAPINQPLLTGYKVIDSLFPIGRGQRELIIGDKQTGKTTIALDTILNQANHNTEEEINVYCVYVAIGQKRSSILEVKNTLLKNNALYFSIIVAATASENAAMQYIAPYVGTAIAEFYRDLGKHALIVYDDLSKHAAAYRQLSLLLQRPAGREAYPGDIFYAHSRLLERSCNLNDNFGGGSLTALPIIETLAGDVSGYIPTNVISITDGQIFLKKDLFFRGMRPAVDVGNSVSRIGSKAQPYVLKQITSEIRLELAQYRDLVMFAKLSDGDVDEVTASILKRGAILTEIMKQGPNQPLPLHKIFFIIRAATAGIIYNFLSYTTSVELLVQSIEKALFEFLDSAEVLETFQPSFDYMEYIDGEDYSDSIEVLDSALEYFNMEFHANILPKVLAEEKTV
jgi:proton translocating ATP synthase F1 alpha subunit